MRSNGKLLAGVLLCIVVIFSTTPQAYAYGGLGAGSTADPYEITSCSELQSIGNDLAASYELMHDIDCAAYSIFPGFSPISGNGTFTGSFDGNGFTIDSLSIDPAGNPDNVSLFGAADGATLTNVTLDHLTVKGGINVGGLVGAANDMTITNITLRNGMVVGTEKVGGIAGYITSNARLKNSRTEATTVKGSSALTNTSYIGGAVGHSQSSSIDYVSTEGTVIGNDQDSSMSEWVGGVAGYSEAGDTVYSVTTVTGGTYVGGLFGQAMYIMYSYSAGSVTGEAHVGGLSGIGWMTFYNFSASSVTGNDATAGGIFGTVWENASFLSFYAGTMMDPAKSGQALCVGIPLDPGGGNGTMFGAELEDHCQPLSADVNSSDYFYGNTTTLPFAFGPTAIWDFVATWRTLPADYPVLRSAPDKPQDIQATPSISAVALSWDPPATTSQAPITGYVLEYAKTGTSAMTTVTAIDPSADSYTITGLEPQTSYTMRLRAVNERGVGNVESFSALTDIDPNAPTGTPGANGALVTQLISALNPVAAKKERLFARASPQPQEPSSSAQITSMQEDTPTVDLGKNPRSNAEATTQSEASTTASAKGISRWWLLLLPVMVGIVWAIKVGTRKA